MRNDFGVDQADGLRRLLVRARHGEAEPSGAGVPASHLLPQREGGSEAAGHPPAYSLRVQTAGYAITSDLASVVCSPSRMASSSISNVSEVRIQTRVITLVSGKSGEGRTSAVINLAVALARSGKDVLVLDEHAAPDHVPGRLGLHARCDLLDVVQGRCKPGAAVLRAGGFSVLSTARAMGALSGFDQSAQQRLESALLEVGSAVDVMLVNAAAGPAAQRVSGLQPITGPCAISSSLARGTALLVVVDATASGITESYALIKRMALEHARIQFGIVVNKVADEQAARTVFENMAKLARRDLSARLEYLGCVPQDDRLKRAMQLGKPVVEAFPAAVSAQAYFGLAQKLLLMPLRQDEAQGGVRTVIRDLMRQASQPLQRLSREIEHVVN